MEAELIEFSVPFPVPAPEQTAVKIADAMPVDLAGEGTELRKSMIAVATVSAAAIRSGGIRSEYLQLMTAFTRIIGHADHQQEHLLERFERTGAGYRA